MRIQKLVKRGPLRLCTIASVSAKGPSGESAHQFTHHKYLSQVCSKDDMYREMSRKNVFTDTFIVVTDLVASSFSLARRRRCTLIPVMSSFTLSSWHHSGRSHSQCSPYHQ